jgi:hypothetical protein
VIDIFEGLYNSAGIKMVISMCVSALLFVLCRQDYLIMAWVIVLVPFLFMAFTTSVLLYQLNLNRTLGKTCDESLVETTILNNPRYKHGYTHLYKYTTTPVKMRFSKCDDGEEEEEEGEEELSKNKNKYFIDSDPSYESFI